MDIWPEIPFSPSSHRHFDFLRNNFYLRNGLTKHAKTLHNAKQHQVKLKRISRLFNRMAAVQKFF